MSKIHFIAIGGAAMHNLALALLAQGHQITGSDDEIYEPSKSLLEKNGLLPAEFGWFPEKITADIDTIVVGMHARADNPELLKAQELGLKIVFMGFGLDSDNLHSPNEKYDIFNFYKGIETIPYFHKYFAEKNA